MNRLVLKPVLALLLLAAGAFVLGCASHRSARSLEQQVGEPVLLAGQAPRALAFAPDLSQPIAVRNTYRDGLPQTIHYEPGRDYCLEGAGEIRRLAGSRIPDYATNVLYGKDDFRHEQFPGYGNGPFFIYVDYSHREKWLRPTRSPELGAALLPKTRQKLAAGEAVRIVAFGDSITAGGETSAPGLIFWERWAQELRKKHPRARLEAINGATGGDTTVQGLQRLEEKVIARHPDLVLVGFGMNDHNREGYGVALDTFTANLRAIVDRTRASAGAELVLFSAFPPNPKWHYGSHRMEAYAAATEQVAREKGCAFADVYHVWMSIAARKAPEELLGNNINHPNDFGHWLYLQAFEGLGL